MFDDTWTQTERTSETGTDVSVMSMTVDNVRLSQQFIVVNCSAVGYKCKTRIILKKTLGIGKMMPNKLLRKMISSTKI